MGAQFSLKGIVVLLIILLAIVAGLLLVTADISMMAATPDVIAAVIPGDVSGSTLVAPAFIPRQFSPWGIDANSHMPFI
jgi:hypothetical protein